MRNKKAEIRVGESRTRCIRLPKLGELAVRECTRDLRRLLRKGRAKILFATVSHRSDGRWHITRLEPPHCPRAALARTIRALLGTAS